MNFSPEFYELTNTGKSATPITNPDYGLDKIESERRLAIHGYNEFDEDEEQGLFSKYLEQFKNPLIQLLLVSVIISIITGQYDDAISITLAILLVVGVGFIQEYRSEQSLKELSKLVPPTCRVIRDGVVHEFLARELVPGDIVLITTGDRVPADIRLLHTEDLSIDESNLTGETESVVKTPSTEFSEPPPILYNNNHANFYDNNSRNFDRSTISENVAYMGTLVQFGHGKGIVSATGSNTHFGSVFKMMQAEEAPRSPLQTNMDELGKHLSLYSISLIGIIVLIGWFQSRPITETFTIGVSLAVAAIPEGLPIVVTVTLALGVIRMARRKAIVKKLPAVETVGCLQILCCDKTGTLTMNQMTVTQIATSELFLAQVTGIGYSPIGDILLDDLRVADQRVQMLSIERLLRVGAICNNVKLDPNGKILGQATEGAMLIAAKKAGLNSVSEEYIRLEERPFNSKRKYMSVKCVPKFARNETPTHYVKGALEVIIDKCSTYSNLGTPEVMTEDRKIEFLRQSQNFEHQGLRVLAVASGHNIDNLTFLGILGIHDAPREGVKEAISVLQNGGISVKMITGDSKFTAVSIARSLGILDTTLNVMSGQELDALVSADKSLIFKADRIYHTTVFYRTTPIHKVTIVKLLQSSGYVVAMTGDGVNDGAALKKADIGIAMGKNGTDVCKEAADVILMDDNLATITVALEEGKGIYYNIRSFIKFQLSTSIAALSLITLSTIMKLPNPLNAMQILYINILMDGPPAQSLGVESVDQDVLKKPPRDVKQPVLTLDLLCNTCISATIIIVGTMFVFVTEVS